MTPEQIKLPKAKDKLLLTYLGRERELAAEFLRVFSPSAEVRGHGVGEDILQTGKKNTLIVGIEIIGQYALKIAFDDGHDTGLYTWPYLYALVTDKEDLWQQYLQRLVDAGASRETQEISEDE